MARTGDAIIVIPAEPPTAAREDGEATHPMRWPAPSPTAPIIEAVVEGQVAWRIELDWISLVLVAPHTELPQSRLTRRSDPENRPSNAAAGSLR